MCANLENLFFLCKFAKYAKTATHKQHTDSTAICSMPFWRSVSKSSYALLRWYSADYPHDIDDYRESPALRVIEVLEREKANVEYYDPWIAEYKYKGEKRQSIKEITPGIVSSYDLIMITAAHTNVDYDMIQKNAKAIFDTKNAMKAIETRDNLEVL